MFGFHKIDKKMEPKLNRAVRRKMGFSFFGGESRKMKHHQKQYGLKKARSYNY